MIRQHEHEMLATPNHDETARQSFAATFSAYLLSDVYPGAEDAYAGSARKKFVDEHGREPVTRTEIAKAMKHEPLYQIWSTLRRAKQELVWEAVEGTVERHHDRLVDKAREIAQGETLGSLTLDPDLEVPYYHTGVDIHVMPGGYHTERREEDIFAGALYDRGVFVYRMGQGGPLNDAMGHTIINNFIKENYPDLNPARILDIGCTIGGNTLPYCDHFPDAEIYGIDVGAPCLRYGHARAEALGKRVHFVQANAEKTDFPDGHFDLVISQIVIHETSLAAVKNIFAECHRLLAPGGLMLHIDAQRQYRDVELWGQFINNWDTYYNAEPFFEAVHELDFPALMGEAGFPEEGMIDTVLATARKREGSDKKGGMFLVGAQKEAVPAEATPAVAGARAN